MLSTLCRLAHLIFTMAHTRQEILLPHVTGEQLKAYGDFAQSDRANNWSNSDSRASVSTSKLFFIAAMASGLPSLLRNIWDDCNFLIRD